MLYLLEFLSFYFVICFTIKSINAHPVCNKSCLLHVLLEICNVYDMYLNVYDIYL